ncbi:MAG: flagellar hook-length control protein FliK [Lachnospiraceae bacterium]|nr:flagellar hook-length control protein FliK [Lachnospiraceae bacterium]
MKMGAVIGQLIAQNTRPTGTNADQKSSAGYRFLQSLEKGSVFEGTILEIKNGQVTIGLANGDLLQARLDMDLSLIQGGSLFFQVKATDENQIALKPFPQETSNNPTLIKALQYAGVEVNSKNLAMVSLMMEEQMPIDKNSVLAMAKALIDCPQSDMRSLIQMQKYQIPVSEKNVVHYEELKDHQMNMVKNLNSVMGETANLINRSLEGMNQPQNIRQLVELLNVFAGEIVPDETEALSPLMTKNDGEILQDGEQINPATKTFVKGEQDQVTTPVKLLTNVLANAQTNAQELLKNDPAIPKVLSEANPLLDKSPELVKEGKVIPDETRQSQSQSQILPGKEVVSLESRLNTILSEWEQTQDPKAFAKVVQDLTMALSKGGVGEASVFNQLLEPTKKMFREFVNQLMERSMTTTPESLEKTPEFFDKLMNQLNHLEGAALEMGKSGNALLQTAGDLKSQIQFLSDFNQVYHYIQIPLKLKQQTTTGELYVYTHQKKLDQQKKDLSAHLHLDMEHLGSTDVYVKLEEKKVSTHFYLENEESFDVILNHLDILTERLNKKGYQVTMQVENTGKKINIVEDFIDPTAKVGKVQRYTIDVKV